MPLEILTEENFTKLPRTTKLHILNLKDRDKVEIVPKGDEHLGSKFYDRKFDHEIVEYCLDNKVFVIGMGDHVECATRDSVGAGIFEQEEILEKQIDEYVSLNEQLAKEGLLLGIHAGNHDKNRVFKHSGVDISRIMAKLLGVRYFGVGVMHQIKVGNQAYTMYTTHGSSGCRLPHTKIKACLDLANMCDVEIYAMGHTHQLSHHTRQFYKVDKKTKTIVEAEKHFLLCGSYLGHWGSYAMEKSYEPMKKGSPKIKLSGTEHQIRVSL